jgi:hypothetical protein
MSKKHLRKNPASLPDSNGFAVWWYEDSRGVEIHWNNTASHGSAVVPWSEIRSALKRKDMKARKAPK